MAWCGVFRRQIYNRSPVNYKIDERDDGWKFNVEFSPCQSARLESSSAESNLALPPVRGVINSKHRLQAHGEINVISAREFVHCSAPT